MATEQQRSSLHGAPVDQVRNAIRSGTYCGQTAGLAPGKLQANLVILPAEYATHFETYCERNPRPCPLVGKTDIGNPIWSALGDIDIRSDVPSYNVYRDGVLAETLTDIDDLWQEDWVAFALGCSFTFETALLKVNIPMPHVDANLTVPMYRTNIETEPSGPFKGGMVVSMRMIEQSKVDLAIETSAQYPWAHGAPVHVGTPDSIGISDIAKPDWGDPPVGHGTPVFWACGVTPQNALEAAKLPLVLTHTPGHMLVTDIDDVVDAFIKHPTNRREK